MLLVVTIGAKIMRSFVTHQTNVNALLFQNLSFLTRLTKYDNCFSQACFFLRKFDVVNNLIPFKVLTQVATVDNDPAVWINWHQIGVFNSV